MNKRCICNVRDMSVGILIMDAVDCGCSPIPHLIYYYCHEYLKIYHNGA